MGNLILSGGGSFQQNLEVYKFLGTIIEKDKPVLYIPLAGDPNHRPYTESLDYIKSIFKPLGIKEVLMWTDLNQRTLGELKSFSAVYFSGGSTLTLLNAIKNSGFEKTLIEYFKDGGTIFGQSAGAIIFGSDVSHTTPEKRVEDYQPLNFIHNKGLWCHYENSDDKLLCEISKQYSIPLIALSDGAAIHVTETNCHVIAKEAFEFRDGRKTPFEFMANE
ncbi:Type 1 glutamine amidotransferase-like domain-containing protein [Falsibacillus pallidus]|uniref:Type 1 glutamine amidotransferase-like domain-containing protein n=1 Tax=Falsibacillus pallidus TaxID=493781 RepID=UPI003D96D8AA